MVRCNCMKCVIVWKNAIKVEETKGAGLKYILLERLHSGQQALPLKLKEVSPFGVVSMRGNMGRKEAQAECLI